MAACLTASTASPALCRYLRSASSASTWRSRNDMKQQSLVILGSTGSVGQSTLDVVARHPDRFRVLALAAGSRVDALFGQVLAHRPRYAVLMAEPAAAELRNRLRAAGSDCEVLAGADALCAVAALPEADAVMAAIVGAAGLAPTLAAVR